MLIPCLLNFIKMVISLAVCCHISSRRDVWFSCHILSPDFLFSLNLLFFNRLYWITRRAGEKQGSGLMKANAWHHRADAISSVVALVGVGEELGSCS